MASPLTKEQAIDLYFMEHRAKVIDLAAFLDRIDRASGEPSKDFRISAMREAIALLLDGQSDRARRILELWSDPTENPIDKTTTKGASGTWNR
ncbi:MAG: hypothetical protein O2800_01095 [Planctomycetota bacterium]|nr:hypothetical protein [Planctomycetota bacterium]